MIQKLTSQNGWLQTVFFFHGHLPGRGECISNTQQEHRYLALAVVLPRCSCNSKELSTLLCLLVTRHRHPSLHLCQHQPWNTETALTVCRRPPAAPCAAFTCQRRPRNCLFSGFQAAHIKTQVSIPILRLYGVFQQPLPSLILKPSTPVSVSRPFLTGELLHHLAHVNFPPRCTECLFPITENVTPPLCQLIPMWFLTLHV